ncbi:tetratricopeptide repeat protein, partial [Planctomycetota bacterium]
MEQRPQKEFLILISIALVLVTGGAYIRLCGYDFISYDDPKYVENNPQVRDGLTWDGFKWAFTERKITANWHPLTWLSLMLDCKLSGGQEFLTGPDPNLKKQALENMAQTCHTTNLFFHLANTLLLFLVLARMTAALGPSALVAALFALHPLHVESVAWISERKDVLSTFFWLLTMWAYVRYAEHPAVKRYILVVVFFILGFMAKPMLVTLPFVLLLMDYWPLKRLQNLPPTNIEKAPRPVQRTKDRKKTAPFVPVFKKTTFGFLILEKLPLFALTVLFCFITFFVQRGAGAVRPIEDFDLKIRLANAVASYGIYIGKVFWPAHLGLFYPHFGMPPSWQIVTALLLLIIISGWALWQRKRPWLLVGWLWFLGTMVPVIGLVQVGDQALADRYTYITLVGLFMALVWGFADILAPWRPRRIVAPVTAVVVLAALTVCTWRQVGYWSDSITLFEHSLKINEKNHLAHNQLGYTFYYRGQPGDLDKAIKHHRQALDLKPDYYYALINLGMELVDKKEYQEGIDLYQRALGIRETANVNNHLGAALMYMHGYDYAPSEGYLRRALELDDQHVNTHLNLAMLLFSQGRFEEAMFYYQQALSLSPNDVRALQGIEQVRTRQLRAQQGNDPQVIFNNARILAQQGKYQAAAELVEKALQLKPDWLQAHQILGELYLYLARPGPAIEHFSEVIKLNPDDPLVLKNLAWLLATINVDKLRRPADAVKHALKANILTNYNQPE